MTARKKMLTGLWIIYLCLLAGFLYRIRNASLRLLMIDIQTGFRHAPWKRDYIIVFLMIVGGIVIFYFLFSQRGYFALRWKVRLGKNRFFNLNTEAIPYRHLAVMVSVTAAMALAAMAARDELQSRGGTTLDTFFVAHALGGIDGKTYTNSREALLYNYNQGIRAFETDFALTADGKLACAHDWNQVAEMTGRNGGAELSKEEFESSVFYGKYTPLSVEELLLFMYEHEDVWVVTDTKSSEPDLTARMFANLTDTARELGVESVLNRLAIQIYNPELYDAICGIYEFPSFIFTLYKYWDDEDVETFQEVCRFCAYHDIEIITMWWDLCTPEIMEIADQYGIIIYVHTLNDMEEVKKLQDIGVTGFYTDFLYDEPEE